MITSFSESRAKTLFTGRTSNKYPVETQRTALRRLLMLDAADCLDDLAAVPRCKPQRAKHEDGGGQKLEFLVRIDDGFHIRFVWRDGGAADVSIEGGTWRG